jgi:16S rRNA (uracil1498-N3)-methyltransferase
VFVPPESWPEAEVGQRLPLPEEAAHHLRRVLRRRPGAAVTLFDGAGREARARLDSGAGGAPLARLRWVRQHDPPPPPRIALWIAALKADKLEWVAQKATELGVDELQVVQTARSVPRPAAAAAERRQARLQRIVQEAARQCGRWWLPRLPVARPLAEALEVAGGSGSEGAGGPGSGNADGPGWEGPAEALSVVLWEATTDAARLGRRLAAAAAPAAVTVLVGPEGGFPPDEIEPLQDRGFLQASLGPSILRAETAALAAVTLVGSRYGRLG